LELVGVHKLALERGGRRLLPACGFARRTRRDAMEPFTTLSAFQSMSLGTRANAPYCNTSGPHGRANTRFAPTGNVGTVRVANRGCQHGPLYPQAASNVRRPALVLIPGWGRTDQFDVKFIQLIGRRQVGKNQHERHALAWSNAGADILVQSLLDLGAG
jgi:hypothetical protein